MSYQLIRGDATSLPLADDSVDAVVTSPPYFSLRAYQDGGEVYDGQIGSEDTPQAFLEALWAVTAECRRVLKPSGSLFCNLGDKYAGGGMGGHGLGLHGPPPQGERNSYRRPTNTGGIPAKSLMGLPWRYAIGCIDQLGLILRAEMIWSKPNGLPESVTDRVRRSHEQWFHFTKEPRYFSAVDEIREEYDAATIDRYKYAKNNTTENRGAALAGDGKIHQGPLRSDLSPGHEVNPLGKLPGSVWTIDSQLWLDGPISFCPRCGRDLRAGSGPDGSIKRATATTGSRATGSAESTESPTSSGSDQSPTATPSTTPATTTRTAPVGSDAHTGDASTPPTSKPSPCETTSCEATPHQDETPAKPTASTATSSPKQTPPSGVTVGASAVCVCEIGLAATAPPSTWVVPTEPLRVPDHLGVDHFAAFPSEWPRRLILGWSPSGVCVECGEGRRPVVERTPMPRDQWSHRSPDSAHGETGKPAWSGQEVNRFKAANPDTITGYACACPNTDAPTRPAVILDPFCGTGTVPAVAHALGRHGIGIDLSADYLRLAEWRCNDPALRAKVLGVDKPKPVIEGQTSLFDEVA